MKTAICPKALVEEKEGVIPIVNGIINVVNGIFFQVYSLNGYRIDELKSAVQKCIRRGDDRVYFYALEMWELGGVFRTNLLNRLKIIASEDIGFAAPYVLIWVKKQILLINKYRGVIKKCVKMLKVKGKLKSWYTKVESDKRNNDSKAQGELVRLLKVLKNCKKSRLVDNMIHANLLPTPVGKKKPVINPIVGVKWGKGLDGDDDKLQGYMQQFKGNLVMKNEVGACYWAEKVYNIVGWNKKTRKTYKGSSKDPIYAVWELLDKLFNRFKCSLGQRKLFRTLFYFFNDIKNNGQRLFLTQAIMFYCRKDGLEALVLDCAVTKDLWERCQTHEKIPMMKEAIDIHTSRGRAKNMGVKEFFDEGGVLINCDIADPYEQRSKEMAIERFKTGMRVCDRMRVIMKKKKNKKKRRRDLNDDPSEQSRVNKMYKV